MGTYPSFAFSPNDNAIIIWAAGQIWHVPVQVNDRSERVAGSAPQAILFEARIEKRLAETRSSETDILKLETQEKQAVHAFTDLKVNEAGSKAVFQGAGVNYIYDIESEVVHQLPVADKHGSYYSPSFVPRAENLVIQARWSDTNFSTFELANLTAGTSHELTGLPLGRYYSPVLCECTGPRRTLAFLKTGGDYHTGDIIATAGAGLYIADVSLSPDSEGKIDVKNVRFVSASPAYGEIYYTKIRFLQKNAKILVQTDQTAYIIDLSSGPDANWDYTTSTVAEGKMSQEIAVSSRLGKNRADVAFVDFNHVYFASGVKTDESVWSKPGNATKGLARLSLDGGHGVVFSGDGRKVFWLLGKF